MFDSLRKHAATSGEVVGEIRAVEVAIAEAEKKLAATESEAHGEILDAGAGGERRARELSGTLEAQRLRLKAMRSGLDRLKVALRAAVEREHDAARTRAETELTECATADAKISAEIADQAVKLLRLIVQRRGHKLSPVIALALCDVATGAMFPSGVTGWQFMQDAALKGDATAKALLEAVESIAGLPDNAERRTAAKNVLAAPFDADAQVTALLKSGAPPAAE